MTERYTPDEPYERDDGDAGEAEYVDDGDAGEQPPEEQDERYLPDDDDEDEDAGEDEPE